MNIHKKKVLVVGGFPAPDSKIVGGIVTTCQALLNSPFAHHFRLSLVDSTQISNPPPSFGIRLILSCRRFLIFFATLVRVRPDAVLLFAADGASLAEKGLMAWTARALRMPALIFPRATTVIDVFERSRFHRYWIIFAFRGAEYFLCQGPTWRNFAITAIGFSTEKSPIIRNWTATQSLLSIGESRRNKRPSGRPTILFLGWLESEKGIFELLQASLWLSDEYGFQLKIAGRGHAEGAARSFIEDKGLDGVVSFCGWVGEGERESLLCEADILVLPSWSEGFPNVIVEAMAAKVAVVATAVGNVPELIKNGEQALLVEPRDAPALHRAMAILLQDYKFRTGLAERGYEFARNKFSLTSEVAKLTSVVDEAISESGLER